MSDDREEGVQEDELWGVGARERFRAAANDLADAVRAHGETLLGMAARPAEVPRLFEANDVLARAAAAYAKAQTALSGTDWPFVAVSLALDDEEDDEEAGGEDGDLQDEAEEDQEDQDQEPGVARFSVLRRADYHVTDADEVMEAGRRAYLEVSPDDKDEGDAASGMDGLGRAVYQLLHAGGPEALDLAPGLARAGATTWIVDPGEQALLGDQEPEEWPDDPFDIAFDAVDRLIFRLDEIDL